MTSSVMEALQQNPSNLEDDYVHAFADSVYQALLSLGTRLD